MKNLKTDTNILSTNHTNYTNKIIYIHYMKLIFKEESYKIIGAAMEVHNELGNGFLEAVYQEALSLEFEEQSIPFTRESKINIYYKDLLLKKEYRADFFCYSKIIIEIKALSELTTKEESQMLNYLKATEMELGILINFGAERLQYKRLANLEGY